MRAVANIHRFEAGTNLNAWLFTILLNLFHSEYRKRRREVEDADGSYAARLSAHPSRLPVLSLRTSAMLWPTSLLTSVRPCFWWEPKASHMRQLRSVGLLWDNQEPRQPSTIPARSDAGR